MARSQICLATRGGRLLISTGHKSLDALVLGDISALRMSVAELKALPAKDLKVFRRL